MSQPVYFHFTLGPVQSFVSQARRTRDFWAGSFILSWLSAVAVSEVIAQCKQGSAQEPWLDTDYEVIQFPKPEKEFIGYLNGSLTDKNKSPQQGSIPNRFKALVDEASFKPTDVEEAVKRAWTALADLVYEKDFKQSKLENLPDWDLWDRQIKGCWEISWSYSPVPEEGAEESRETPVLDQRKNWRSYAAPNEPGVKCMMMDGWQELSGIDTPNEKSLSAFWKPLRESVRKMKTDIRKQEYLCAIAFVKRRFPRHFEFLNEVPMPAGWKASGWVVDEGRPSVSYMAAANWWAETLEQANSSASVKACVDAFHKAADKVGSHSEWESSIKCIDDVTAEKRLRAMDGDLFFESTFENPNLYDSDTERDQAKQALKALRALNSETKLGAAPPFYAVLMMDGDQLGKQMLEVAKQASIAEGLQTFTNEVSNIVKDNSGFLVYAGGDDVLAVLPCDDALKCALEVREYYETVFEKYPDIKTSISAAIEYAHIRMPLMKVLKDAHQLLDDVAKDETGRDAIAVRVWKPGGKALQWAQPWSVACEGEGKGKKVVIDRIAKEFIDNKDDLDGQYSNKFFYKIRERLPLFNPPQDSKGSSELLETGEGGESHAVNLMAAEYVSSGLCNNLGEGVNKIEHARIRVKPLIEQCCIDNKLHENKRYEADAALLVRFLAQKGVV